MIAAWKLDKKKKEKKRKYIAPVMNIEFFQIWNRIIFLRKIELSDQNTINFARGF